MQENDRCYSLKIIRFEFKTRHDFEIYNPWFLIGSVLVDMQVQPDNVT